MGREPAVDAALNGLLSADDAHAVASAVLSHADGRAEVEVSLQSTRHAVTRFANNVIHQNVEDVDHTVSVRVQADGRSASVTGNTLDRSALASLVDRARALAQLLPRDEAMPPLATPHDARTLAAAAPSTIEVTPDDRAAGVARMVAPVREAGLTAAGTYVTDVTVHAVANSRGLSRYHVGTAASLTLTAYGDDSSGWTEQHAPAASALDPDGAARRVVEKALTGRQPVEVPPGEYDVVLEASAVADLVAFLAWLGFGAQSYQEGRSFLTGRMGESVTGDAITIVDDAFDERTIGVPFDAEGVARERVTLIDGGRASGVVHDTRSAARDGVRSTGHALPQPNPLGPIPMNLVVSTGTSTVEDMIAETSRGILVTRFWYNRVVDPLRTIITGMTRDGTFLIENGRVTRGVKNLRFNESVLGALARADRIGASASLTAGVVAPPLRVRGFRFTGVTRF